MKTRKNKLWIYFTAIVLAIMFVTAFIVISLTFFLLRAGHLRANDGNPFLPLVALLLMSVFTGTAISIFVAKKILNPIAEFSKAVAAVAKGDFSIRLAENERIEEIRDLTRNFNTMVRELSGIETLRNDFVVNVSHEFKTPIAAIEGYATLLQDKDLSEAERDDYTRIIISSSHQLAALSDNILRLSKLENQEVVFEKESFRLDEQIRQAVLVLEPEWTRKELDLHIDLEKITYCCNAQLLWQVWMNIIGNAVKFTPQGGNIEIRVYNDEINVIARISDTGCGMDENIKGHIFDKFYQGDTARSSDGNGLGLALVRRIVDLCGGDIVVESKPGKGSSFSVLLPIST